MYTQHVARPAQTFIRGGCLYIVWEYISLISGNTIGEIE